MDRYERMNDMAEKRARALNFAVGRMKNLFHLNLEYLLSS
jgi:hypothetical protein